MFTVKFSDGFIQDLKDKNDISDLVSQYVSLKRKGSNMQGLCPFHSERTPSFFVYPASGSFYCFGCGAGGDAITFLRLIEGFDYIEAVKFLAQRAGINLPDEETDDSLHKKKMILYEINRETAKFYHECLCGTEGKKARDYLLGRGLKISTVKHFGLGYAPQGGYSIVNHLSRKGYKDEDMILANVASKSRNGHAYDRFRDRVMFPIIDLRGNVIAFGGRIMDQGQPKYLNTSDTLVFKKSDNIFAFNFAKKNASENIILAEGYMDVISLHQAGFTNAVATLGTALTDGQVRLMSRYTKEVIISYDSDEAGRKASDRAIKMFRESGVVVRVLAVPKGKDPDEFIKSYGKDGASRFRELIQNAANDVEYRLARAKIGYNLNNTDDKVKYLNECVKILAELSSKIECEIYAGKLSEEVGIERKSILTQVDRLKKKKYKSKEIKEFKEIQRSMLLNNAEKIHGKNTDLRSFAAEEALLSAIINNQDMVNNILSRIDSKMFSSDINRKIYEKICCLNDEGRIINVTTLSSDDFSVNEIGYIAKLTCKYVPSNNVEQDINEYISVMKYESEAKRVRDEKMDDYEIKQYIENLKNIKK